MQTVLDLNFVFAISVSEQTLKRSFTNYRPTRTTFCEKEKKKEQNIRRQMVQPLQSPKLTIMEPVWDSLKRLQQVRAKVCRENMASSPICFE